VQTGGDWYLKLDTDRCFTTGVLTYAN
jgi:hypothetical protein